MNEQLDQRVLGAIRWIDGVTQAAIRLPLVVTSTQLRFIRNLPGLTVITHAAGLENHTETFDLAKLPPSDNVPDLSRSLEGQVDDPSGTYLPSRFTVRLPRDASPALLPPDQHRPPSSLFTPIDVPLLPSPAARLSPGCAQVRVLVQTAQGKPIRNALVRVVATADGTVLGYGLSDHRGETLVAVPGLKHFAPGATEEDVVTLETEARVEVIFPPVDQPVIDWTSLKHAAVASGNTDTAVLKLKPGGLYSRRYPFVT